MEIAGTGEVISTDIRVGSAFMTQIDHDEKVIALVNTCRVNTLVLLVPALSYEGFHGRQGRVKSDSADNAAATESRYILGCDGLHRSFVI